MLKDWKQASKASIEVIQSIGKNNLTEIKKLMQPPHRVKITAAALLITMGYTLPDGCKDDPGECWSPGQSG